MDANDFCAASWLCAYALLSWLLSEFFRREALRYEGRLAAHGRVHVAALFPELVPAALSIRLRSISVRGRIILEHKQVTLALGSRDDRPSPFAKGSLGVCR